MMERMEKIPVRPWICVECGNIQLLSDRQVSQKVGSCDNPECQADDVVPAGPRQKIQIGLDQRGVKIRKARRP